MPETDTITLESATPPRHKLLIHSNQIEFMGSGLNSLIMQPTSLVFALREVSTHVVIEDGSAPYWALSATAHGAYNLTYFARERREPQHGDYEATTSANVRLKPGEKPGVKMKAGETMEIVWTMTPLEFETIFSNTKTQGEMSGALTILVETYSTNQDLAQSNNAIWVMDEKDVEREAKVTFFDLKRAPLPRD